MIDVSTMTDGYIYHLLENKPSVSISVFGSLIAVNEQFL